jgi:hypothetical protein
MENPDNLRAILNKNSLYSEQAKARSPLILSLHHTRKERKVLRLLAFSIPR